MTRSFLCGLLALLSVGALGVLPVACQSGGVGDPCTPEDEYNTTFPGFKIEQENIESRSFQCQTRICLVNHFQGRASCPAGQAQPKACKPANHDSDCDTANGQKCKQSETFAPICTVCDGSDPNCVDTPCPSGLTCDKNRQICTCTTSQTINGVDYACEAADSTCTGAGCPQVLHSYVCHKELNCQTAGKVADNLGKDCCVPGTDTPVSVSVCGQCNSSSFRNADQAVYCSCRCCVPCCPDGTPNEMADDQGCSNDKSICGPACDPNFNYCDCPSGYTCTGIRQNVGLGDNQLAGAYCIKSKSAFKSTSAANCGAAAPPLQPPPPPKLRHRRPRRLHQRLELLAVTAMGGAPPSSPPHAPKIGGAGDPGPSSREAGAAEPMGRAQAGAWAERLVAAHLAAAGLEILGINVRVGRLELDIVARDGPVIAVVEVRARGPGAWVRPLDSVDPRKRARVRRAGERLWRERFARDRRVERMRFDVAAVDLAPGGEARVEIVKAAF